MARSRTRRSADALFAGPGEIRQICRSIDWSATSLGPVHRWPPGLRTAVRTCLEARIPMAVWAGPEHVLVYNDGVPPVLGPGKHPWALGRRACEVLPEVWDQLQPEVRRVLQGEPTIHEDARFLLRKGASEEEGFFTYSFTPIREEDGRVVGALAVFVETTSRVRALDEQEARYHAVFRNASDAVVVIDPEDEGRVLSANPAACRLFGYSEAEFAAVDRTAMLDTSDPELGRVLQARREHGDATGVLTYVRKDGSRFKGELRSTLFRDARGRQLGVAIIRDVTERERGEEALRLSIAERETARAELERSTRKLNEIVTSIEDDFYVLDRNWVFVYANRQFTSKIGKEPEDFLGRNLWEMFPRHLGSALEENFRAAMERRETRRFEVGGQYTPAVYRMTAFPSAEGITVLGADITEQKRAEESLARSEERARAQAEELDAVIEAMQEGLNISDGQGRVLRMNRAGATMLGYRSREEYALALPEFQDTWALETTDGAPVTIEAWPFSRALRGESFTDYELVVRRLDGSLTRTLSYAGTPIRDDAGAIVRALITFRDISGLAEARRALSEANAQLRDADRRKNEFMATLSHELRNPLAPIRNALYILDRAAPGSDQARRAKVIVDRQVAQLARLVDDLLDLTRITRNKIQLQRQPLELNELVARTAEDHRLEFDQAGVRLELVSGGGRVWVSADANRLAQAIGNLLQNAAKFTPRGGRVVASVSADEPRRHAVIRVVDSGVGMTAEMLERLFQPFMQAETTLDRTKGGLGLGLALVKVLVDLHEGTVEARSPGPGEGAEFVLRLPLASAAEDRPRPPARPAARRHRVLVVEDNADAAETLRELLELDEHEVSVAHNGPSGLAKARELVPTVVLCDIGLPGMDGYQVARALRADPALRQAKLVALSGYALPEDVQRAHEAGFDLHLAKPPTLERIRETFARFSVSPGVDGADGSVSGDP